MILLGLLCIWGCTWLIKALKNDYKGGHAACPNPMKYQLQRHADPNHRSVLAQSQNLVSTHESVVVHTQIRSRKMIPVLCSFKPCSFAKLMCFHLCKNVKLYPLLTTNIEQGGETYIILNRQSVCSSKYVRARGKRRETSLTRGQCMSHEIGWHSIVSRGLLASIWLLQLHSSHGCMGTRSPTLTGWEGQHGY